jgi:hypothetical protein
MLLDAAIRAALSLVALHEIPAALDVFVEHLERPHEMTRPKQIEVFQRGLRLTPG